MVEKDQRPVLLITLMMISAILYFSQSLSADAQDAPPQVQVVFSIHAQDFKENLPQIDVAEKTLARSAVKRCREHFPFLRWGVGSTQNMTGRKGEHRLHLTLTQEKALPLPRIILSFSCVIEGSPVELPAIAGLTIYQAFNMDRPTHNPQEFTIKVMKEINEQFTNESFRELLHENFLSSIPLIRRVVVDESDKRIIVPIQWELLRAGGNSVLEVDFVARISHGDEKGGSMKLSSVQMRRHEPNRGTVQCAVKSFDFAPILIVRLGDWHEEISRIFSGEVGIKVFMETYVGKVNLNTEAGLVTRPD